MKQKKSTAPSLMGKTTQVLKNFQDLEGPLGLQTQKSTKEYTSRYSYPRPTLFLPRCHSLLGLTIRNQTIVSDVYSLYVIPANSPFQIEVLTSVAEWIFLFPTEDLFQNAIKLYQIPSRFKVELTSQYLRLPRSNWINEIIHRYVFEREIAGNHNNVTTEFLETEICKEILFLLQEPNQKLKNRFNLDEQNLEQKSDLIRKAMNYIESNLLSDLSMEELASAIGASSSTLLRQFKKELNLPPVSYIRQRRLEEAAILLRSGKFSVSEVADRMLYDDVAAFISAFKKHFTETPTKFIPD